MRAESPSRAAAIPAISHHLWPRSSPPHMPKTALQLWLALAAVGTLLSTVLPEQEDSFLTVDSYPCPNCVFSNDINHQRQLDLLRIETIKHQLLSKLGLRAKPNVTSTIPRDVLLQTLYRSEEARTYLQDLSPANYQTSYSAEEEDYFAKTSEIITFADPGRFISAEWSVTIF